MAIHFVILLFMLLIVIGIIATGLFTDIPILIPLGFFFLMLSGLFVTISEGVIIDQRVSVIDAETLEYSYEDVILGLDDPIIFSFSQIAFYFGLVLTLFSSFAWFINPMDKKSPFNY
jgi:hypothetical protein